MEEPKGKPEVSPAAKEKIREFCYDLALALRRITGKAVENDLPPFMPAEGKMESSSDGPDEELCNLS
jgi:hypothetical protein